MIVKGTEPRPIIGYAIVLFIVILVITNQELLEIIPGKAFGVGVILVSIVIGSFFTKIWTHRAP